MNKKNLLVPAFLTTFGIGYQTANAQAVEQSVKMGAKFYEIFFGKNSENKLKASKNYADTAKVNRIYSEGELTVAGNGVFLTSYTNPSMTSDDGLYDLTRKFSSKDKISYHALTSKKIREILNNSSVKSSVKKRINDIQKKIGKNSRGNHSRFERALKDGKLTEGELQNIGDGIYAYLVTTGKQAVVGFFEVRRSKSGGLEKKAGEITEKTKLPDQLYEVYTPEAGNLDNTSKDSSIVPEKLFDEKYLSEIAKFEEKKFKLIPKEKDFAEKEKTEVKEKGVRREEFYPGDIPPMDSSYVSPKKDTLVVSEKEARRGEFYPEDLDVVIVEDTSKTEGKAMQKTAFGLEAMVGTNGEKIAGVFVKVPLASWLNVEGYGDYFAAKGNPFVSDMGTQVTQRERQLIGSATYKQRTDDIHTTAEERAISDIGAGITFRINDNFEFPLRIGAGLMRQEKTLDGKSTISFERNDQPLQEPSIITNTQKESPVTKGVLSLSAGARYNLTKNLSFGASINRTGKRNSGRINLRVGF